jgi:hypothetical protein
MKRGQVLHAWDGWWPVRTFGSEWPWPRTPPSRWPVAGGSAPQPAAGTPVPADREGRPQDLLGRHCARCGDGAGASKVDRLVTFPTDDFKHGRNTVAIAYELFGSTEFGETARMAELNGIESIRLGADPDRATLVNTWDVQMFPAPVGRPAAQARLSHERTTDGEPRPSNRVGRRAARDRARVPLLPGGLCDSARSRLVGSLKTDL